MHITQLIIVIAYFLLLAVIGKIAKRFSTSSTEFLIAGRNLGTLFVTMSVVGVWLGGMSTIGTAQKAFQTGFFPMWYNISTGVGMFLFGLTIAGVCRKYNMHTVGEIMETLFDRNVRIVASLAFVVGFVILSYLQLQAIGGLFAQLFGDILTNVGGFLHRTIHVPINLVSPFHLGIVVAGIIVIFHVYEGGMKSIALTNLIHIVLLYSSILVVFVLLLWKCGGYTGLFASLREQFAREGLTPVQAAAQAASYRNPLSCGIDKVFAWLLGGVLAGFASQASLQPIFAARSISVAKRSSLLSAAIIIPLGVIVSTMGIAVRGGLFGELPANRSAEALPFLLMNDGFIPPWLSGLAAAGIFAAILSTVAPVMFAVSTILVKDFYHLLLHRNAEDRHLLKASRVMTVFVGLLTIPAAVLFRGGILDAAYITYSIRGSAAILIILGLWGVTRKAGRRLVTPAAAVAAIVSSTVGVILYVLVREKLGFTLDKVYVAILFVLASIAIVSPLTRKSVARGAEIADETLQ
ncbi:MAG: sodium:solute symporter family protein [Phycisphaerae bacterium]|nr:sodium:solute symporter family protein [Phycisphaerae bacterium]